jgi:hypothetical protein
MNAELIHGSQTDLWSPRQIFAWCLPAYLLVSLYLLWSVEKEVVVNIDAHSSDDSCW